jgi:hypothetical protein
VVLDFQFLEINSPLWSLIFIKSYGKRRGMSPKSKCDERTWREWVWKGLYRINHLKKDVARYLLLLSSFCDDHTCCWRCRCCCCSSHKSQIKLSNKLISDSQQRSLMVVDGIDCRMQTPWKNGFNPSWYSHKYHKPRVRY